MEESFWRDKARELFVKCGDKNTNYFQAKANLRYKLNKINCLKKDDGEWIYKRDEIGMHICDFYKKLFSNPYEDNTPSLPLFSKCINAQQNEDLIKNFNFEELKTVVFSMHPHKSPGPDGFSPIFFQKNWSCLNQDLLKFMNACLVNPQIIKKINHANVTLIPKTMQPTNINNYRPFSLCNVLYRIFSKLLANRFKVSLNLFISPFQNAFVKHRHITDNTIIVGEVMKNLNKKKGFQGHLAIKIDLKKAFDQIDWNFLLKALESLGYSNTWCNIIKACISTTSLSFNLDGAPFGFITPERGLRQGDPLPPFLFITCIAYMPRLLRNLSYNNKAVGIKLSTNSPTISHLLFPVL